MADELAVCGADCKAFEGEVAVASPKRDLAVD
jgi:hypothetical protein